MPDNEPDGVIETKVATLPAATRPTPGTAAMAEEITPALSDEELEERQRRFGTRRKPAGPPETMAPTAAIVDDTPADVPETEAIDAREIDPAAQPEDDGGGGNGEDSGLPPLDSSE